MASSPKDKSGLLRNVRQSLRWGIGQTPKTREFQVEAAKGRVHLLAMTEAAFIMPDGCLILGNARHRVLEEGSHQGRSPHASSTLMDDSTIEY